MTALANILVVDDDDSITASVALLLKQHGYRALRAAQPSAALAVLDETPIDLVLLDMNFSRQTSGEEGLALLRDIRARVSVPIVLMTAWGTIDLAVRGMRAGAVDFVTKPWQNDRLLATMETALGIEQARRQVGERSRRELDERFDFRGLIGEDPRLLELLDLVGRVASTDASVLITGESGTGKEELAEAIHRNSRRAEGPFVKVNLGGVSASLFESEMFGHVRGAFTDARADRKGRFEVADGGSIFLDEIGELEATSQVKLLRVLQDHTYEVLGSSQSRRVDVRVISATNRRLEEMVEQGSFREDLYYRLNLITLQLPPLRDRPGDIPLLARHFLDRCGQLYGRDGLELETSAIAWLTAQSWPGNIRQLKQAIERAVLVSGETRLGAEAFSIGEGATPTTHRGDSLPSPGGMTLDEIERAMIEKCLREYAGNISQTARALGLSRAALYRRFARHGLDPARFQSDDDPTAASS
ncbi:MAG: sigma-54 dependent transcriptional regulator [Acidobacteriota bacterium]